MAPNHADIHKALPIKQLLYIVYLRNPQHDADRGDRLNDGGLNFAGRMVQLLLSTRMYTVPVTQIEMVALNMVMHGDADDRRT